MSYIKRKRDRRDYELRRMFDQFARMPQRIVMPLPVLPDNYEPSNDRIWTVPEPATFTPIWGDQ